MIARTIKSRRSCCQALLLVSTLTSQPTHATIYCSAGGGYLKVGMSTAQVERNCGKPISQTKEQKALTRNIAVQQLFYNIRQVKRTLYGNRVVPNANIEMMVTIKNNKVFSIHISGTKTQGASICANGTIQVGSSVNSVTQACGAPNYVNQSYQKFSNGGKSVEQETWTIKPTQYGPTKTLIFNDGILSSIE